MKANNITGAASLNKSSLQYARLQMENSLQKNNKTQPDTANNTKTVMKEDKGAKADFTA